MDPITNPEGAEVKKQSGGFFTFILDIIQFVLVALLIVVPIRAFVAQPFIVSGESMHPTFENGEYLLVDELSYHFRTPERGEVVIFRFPRDPKKFFIKRVIGLPGETIAIRQNQIIIKKDANDPGTVLSEPYIENTPGGSVDRTLGPEEYFVLGDNRGASSDSRYWGPVPEDLIVGRAFLRLFPISEAKVLPGNYDLVIQ